MARPSLIQTIAIPANVLTFLLLMVMAWGDVRGFFGHPVRVGMVAIMLIAMPVMTWCTAGRSRGVEHSPDERPFFPLLVAHSLLTAWVMPYMDVRDQWTLPGGDVVRWAGLAFLAAGSAIRMTAMIVLGKRFSSVVALQPDHALHTTGLYARIRHPSYLGILLMDLGFAGIFRSAVALLVLPVVVWMFARRMDVEERFMRERFGDTWLAYADRTARLVPGLY